ncbi:MAG: glycoside hydrolase family 16 protein [Chthonomonadales bacterium]|nr:glycoside hydrolase family 16 protein [Chthonomonadales bacterium]
MQLVPIAVALTALLPAQPPPDEALPLAPPGKVWKLAFSDEFAGRKLDESRWEAPPDAARRDGWWMRKAVTLDGRGHLVIETRKDGDRWVDGCVRTRGRFEHAFGYYVVRARMPTQPGHWPAFWLYNACEGNPGEGGVNGAEIDIFEKPWLEDRINCALHWDGYGPEHRSSGKRFEVPGVSKGWHTFALWWSEETYVFYVDGKEIWRTADGGVCREPLYVKLSDEIGDWAGDIRRARLPDRFVVDYVRVYDLVDGAP